MKKNGTNEIDGYISSFPVKTQQLLQQVRHAISTAAPAAEEKIAYGIPTFTLNKKNLVHFAAYEHHIGFYPAPSAIENFKKELSAYKGAKGSVQFPIDKAMPLVLITKIVTFRVKENEAKVSRQPATGFLPLLSAPARRALENKGITTLTKLSTFTEAGILALHGIGPSALPTLRTALAAKKKSFKKQ